MTADRKHFGAVFDAPFGGVGFARLPGVLPAKLYPSRDNPFRVARAMSRRHLFFLRRVCYPARP